PLRASVGITGALILLAAATTPVSGFWRLAYSLGEHGQLPRAFGRLSRRAHVSPTAILSVSIVASVIVIATSFFKKDVQFLAGLFSFGVLLAFTAAQLAVIKLRVDEPELARPYRTPFNVVIRGAEVPVPAVVGSIATFAVWVLAMITHPGARYAGPAWLAAGLVVFVAVRHAHGEGLMERVTADDDRPLESAVRFKTILVPLKIGLIGDEITATSIQRASEHQAEAT